MQEKAGEKFPPNGIEKKFHQTKRDGKGEYHLAAFGNLPVKRTVPFHKPPKRLRFSSTSIGSGKAHSIWFPTVKKNRFFHTNESAPVLANT